MKTTWGMFLCGVLGLLGNAEGQSLSLVQREICEFRAESQRLGEVIEQHLHGSIFEQRLHNDAAELYRVASRMEGLTERHASPRQLQAEARVLSIVIERVERTLDDVDEYQLRHRHAPGAAQCSTRAVRSQVARMCHDVSNLQRDIETLVALGSGRNFEQQHGTWYRPQQQPQIDSWNDRSFQTPHSVPQDWRSGYRGYSVPSVPSARAPAISFGNGRFSIQFGQ